MPRALPGGARPASVDPSRSGTRLPPRGRLPRSPELSERAAHERLRKWHLPLGARQRGRGAEVVEAVDAPRDRGHACEGDASLAAGAGDRNAHLRERPALAVHRLEVDARLNRRQFDLEQELAVLESRRAAITLVREPIQLLDRELALARA